MKFARFQSVKNKASSKRFNICRASFPTTFLLASKVRRGLEAKNALVAAPCINRSSDISCGDLTNNAPKLRKISNNQKEKQTNIDIIQEKYAPNKIFLSRCVTALTIIYQVQQIEQELWFTNNGMTSSVTLHDSFAYPSSIRIIPATPLPHSAIRKKVVMKAFRVVSWLDFIVSWFDFMIARHDFCISYFEINLGVVAESLWI